MQLETVAEHVDLDVAVVGLVADRGHPGLRDGDVGERRQDPGAVAERAVRHQRDRRRELRPAAEDERPGSVDLVDRPFPRRIAEVAVEEQRLADVVDHETDGGDGGHEPHGG